MIYSGDNYYNVIHDGFSEYVAVTKSGTYIVVLKNDQLSSVQIGKLASLNIRKGYYVYVGSAFGSGGVIARLKHHAKVSKRPHWHLDYLRAEMEFHQAYAEFSNERNECEWASQIAKNEIAIEPLKGFGSSDCHCRTHLFYFSSQAKVKRAIGEIRSVRKVSAADLA